MKKSLLLSIAAATCSMAVIAETTPTLYPDASFQRISADGSTIISEVYGTMVIYDLVNGTSKVFDPGEEWTNSYSSGLGNCITADGSVIVGSTTESGDASYYFNGEWHQLNVPSVDNTNLANGITPDGQRICGNIGLASMTLEDVIMQAPAYWDRNADGSYGEYHLLPYPTKDFFDEKPQYVTAITIAADGKTIFGQMTFSNGMMNVPVVYTEGANGEWSYSLPTKHLFNPAGLEPVVNPGDGPSSPNYEDYMTDEEKEAYNNAINEYYAAGDWSLPYPEYTSFMTEEELAAYQAAYDAYQAAYAEWDAQFTAYWDYANAVMEASPNFLFNNVLLSTDGKYLVGTLDTEDPNADPTSWFPSRLYVPCTLDLATGELTKIALETTCLAACTANDGIILGYNGQNKIPMTGYVIKNGEVQTILDYMKTVKPEYGQWIVENMTRETVTGYDPETWDEIIEEVTFTGMTIATPDMKTIAMWNNSPRDENSFTEGVIFPDMPEVSGIRTITLTKQGNLSVGANGSVNVPAGFAALQVYSINGACVKAVANPAGNVALNLQSGVYIVKGTRTDGSVSVIKLAK